MHTYFEPSSCDSGFASVRRHFQVRNPDSGCIYFYADMHLNLCNFIFCSYLSSIKCFLFVSSCKWVKQSLLKVTELAEQLELHSFQEYLNFYKLFKLSLVSVLHTSTHTKMQLSCTCPNYLNKVVFYFVHPSLLNWNTADEFVDLGEQKYRPGCSDQ